MTLNSQKMNNLDTSNFSLFIHEEQPYNELWDQCRLQEIITEFFWLLWLVSSEVFLLPKFRNPYLEIHPPPRKVFSLCRGCQEWVFIFKGGKRKCYVLLWNWKAWKAQLEFVKVSSLGISELFLFFSGIRGVLLVLTEVTNGQRQGSAWEDPSCHVIPFIYEDGLKCSAFEHV